MSRTQPLQGCRVGRLLLCPTTAHMLLHGQKVLLLTLSRVEVHGKVQDRWHMCACLYVC
jgi:hypothetical protein